MFQNEKKSAVLKKRYLSIAVTGFRLNGPSPLLLKQGSTNAIMGATVELLTSVDASFSRGGTVSPSLRNERYSSV